MTLVENQSDSVTKFLNAAEEIYIESGYQGATIRKICDRAGVSLAILNRHWPNKEALFGQLFAKHFNPIHKEQFALFDKLISEKNNLSEITPYEILLAFYTPAFVREGRFGPNSHAVYCRALIDPASEAKKIVAGLISQARSRLIELLKIALPSKSETEFFLIINLVLGGYIFPQAFSSQLASAMKFKTSEMDWTMTADTIARLISDGIAIK